MEELYVSIQKEIRSLLNKMKRRVVCKLMENMRHEDVIDDRYINKGNGQKICIVEKSCVKIKMENEKHNNQQNLLNRKSTDKKSRRRYIKVR